ncbi:hypothetical protein CARUB_v10003479mg [Capsella rubella]|uniref:Uncharacterized protein n=1 Tax=Capsella rubella TaxID=81985 RepID=R0H0J6_9BRAS|nr:hypothetical protein CARUB_v10003479mg [Capsella rubella]
MTEEEEQFRFHFQNLPRYVLAFFSSFEIIQIWVLNSIRLYEDTGTQPFTTFLFSFGIRKSHLLTEVKKDAAVRLLSLYDEIRPAIKEHERDSQDWQQVWQRNGYKQAVINIEFDL